MHDLKERIRQANPITEVIGERVPLKPAGRNFVGLCPLHNDLNKPNLTVYPETESYFCFACGKGGDVFKFVMDIEGVPFKEAARILADRKGIPFSSNGKDDGADDNKRSKETTLTEAAHLYHQAMTPEVIAYLKDRGITEETIEKYRIGYCSGDTPTAHRRNPYRTADLSMKTEMNFSGALSPFRISMPGGWFSSVGVVTPKRLTKNCRRRKSRFFIFLMNLPPGRKPSLSPRAKSIL